MLKGILNKNSKIKKSNEEVPPRAKKHNIRVSKPYGLFPQDVETVLENIETERDNLLVLIDNYKKEIEQLKEDNQDLKLTITQLKFDMSLIEVPDGNESNDFQMMNKLKLLKNKKVESVLEDDELEIVSI